MAYPTGNQAVCSAPLFLSYRWREGVPPTEVALLDRELRLRGVPMLRDVRDLYAAAENEREAREALEGSCCGCLLYFNEEVLDSWFITGVELDAVRRRMERDPGFFLAAVFDGVGEEQCEALLGATGVDPRDFQGLILTTEGSREKELRAFSADLLRRYLVSAGPGPASLRADSWGEISWTQGDTLHLNWAGEDGGSGRLPVDWRLLKDAVADVRRALAERGQSRVALSGNLHLSAAFLLGWEFREATGWTIEAEHPRAPFTTGISPPSPQGFSLVARPSQNDSQQLVACICASADCTRAMLRHRDGEAAARVRLTVLPPGGRAGRESLDGVDLNALAAAVVDAIREARVKHRVDNTHFYLACPWTLALALGWSFASSGSAVVHEASADKSDYHANPLLLP